MTKLEEIRKVCYPEPFKEPNCCFLAGYAAAVLPKLLAVAEAAKGLRDSSVWREVIGENTPFADQESLVKVLQAVDALEAD